MRIGIISGVIGLFVTLSVHAQKSDSIKSLLLPDVVVTESYQQRQAKKSALAVDVVDQDFLRKHFTGNFMQAMENIPGVQAMDIGSGFCKPMIRGMGFNRIAVLENDIVRNEESAAALQADIAAGGAGQHRGRRRAGTPPRCGKEHGAGGPETGRRAGCPER